MGGNKKSVRRDRRAVIGPLEEIMSTKLWFALLLDIELSRLSRCIQRLEQLEWPK